MVHKSETDKTEEPRNKNVANVMAEEEFTQEMVRVVSAVNLQTLSKTSDLVAKNARGVVQIDVFTQFEQSYSCKV